MTNVITSFGNQAPMKLQCAECHWQGLASDLKRLNDPRRGDEVLACPVCRSPFARYPQRIEHLWSDPY
jgi:NAD-dependent SIR2 family protein deacetylase